MAIDHETIRLAVVGAFVPGLAALVFLGIRLTAALRESQRMTRAVAGLVYEESARIIAGLDRLR